MSQDHAIALQPVRQSDSALEKKKFIIKKFSKNGYLVLEWLTTFSEVPSYCKNGYISTKVLFFFCLSMVHS